MNDQPDAVAQLRQQVEMLSAQMRDMEARLGALERLSERSGATARESVARLRQTTWPAYAPNAASQQGNDDEEYDGLR
jgi:hypothetical protein